MLKDGTMAEWRLQGEHKCRGHGRGGHFSRRRVAGRAPHWSLFQPSRRWAACSSDENGILCLLRGPSRGAMSAALSQLSPARTMCFAHEVRCSMMERSQPRGCSPFHYSARARRAVSALVVQSRRCAPPRTLQVVSVHVGLLVTRKPELARLGHLGHACLLVVHRWLPLAVAQQRLQPPHLCDPVAVSDVLFECLRDQLRAATRQVSWEPRTAVQTGHGLLRTRREGRQCCHGGGR